MRLVEDTRRREAKPFAWNRRLSRVSARQAGSCYGGTYQAYSYQTYTYQAAPVYVTPQSVQPAPQAPAKTLPAPATPAKGTPQANVYRGAPGDPYGFTVWLNATRASYGLPTVGYDPNLSNWAAVNNSHQNARGLGHYVMGPARRQNSAMGSYGVIGPMWLGSSLHRAALLDPSIRYVGISGSGSYWTFNAN